MTGRLKAVPAALFTTLAATALAAPGASAIETFHAGVPEDFHTTTLTAASLGNQVFTGNIGELKCEEVSLSSSGDTVTANTTHEITVKPIYAGCTALNGLTAVVKMTSCDFALLSTTIEGAEHAAVYVECTTGGDEIDAEVFFLGAFRSCLKIPAHKPTSAGVTYDTGEYEVEEKKYKDVKVTVTAEGVKYTTVGICGSEEVLNDGTYTGTITLKGDDALGKPRDFMWK